MKKQFIYISIVCGTMLVSGCMSSPDPVAVVTTKDQGSIVIENMVVEAADVADNNSENIAVDPLATKDRANNGLYDTTYLEEENGSFIYILTDQSIIEKYDDLYATAFVDLIDSYNRVTGFNNQRFDFSQPLALDYLVLDYNEDKSFINTGSYYESDYGLDLSNVGYTYVDLDSDGVFELIFGVLSDTNAEWIPEDFFERAYALVDGDPVKICEGGSRDLYWLGLDGCIYETGSGGAAYNGTWRLHFDPSQLKSGENVSWGSSGFIQDEFLGCWEKPVHIIGPITDMDTDAKRDPAYSETGGYKSKLYRQMDCYETCCFFMG